MGIESYSPIHGPGQPAYTAPRLGCFCTDVMKSLLMMGLSEGFRKVPHSHPLSCAAPRWRATLDKHITKATSAVRDVSGDGHRDPLQPVGTDRTVVIKTWEGTLADGALMLAGHGREAWPVHQIKTTPVWNKSGKSRNRQFKFLGTSKYPGCLMVCCALLENETLCWLIPGNALTKMKTLTVTESPGEWDAPYAVAPGDLLAAMLNRVHESWWVTCSAHDATYFEPQTAKQRLEVKGYRELMRLEVEHGVVDCVITQREMI